MRNVFIDANVILDAWLEREGFENAETILQMAEEQHLNVYWTTSVIHICSYWLRKAYGAAKAKQILLSMAQTLLVIDATQQSVTRAIKSDMSDVEDALQYFAALERHLDVFISKDRKLKNAALPILEVLTPAAFLKIV